MSCIAARASRLLEETTAKMLSAADADALRQQWAEFVVKAEKLIADGRREWGEHENLQIRFWELETERDNLRRKLRDQEHIDRVGDGIIPRIVRGDLRLNDYEQARLAGIPTDRLELLAGVR